MIYKLAPEWEEKLQQALRRVQLLEEYGYTRGLADDERANVAFALRDFVVEALTDKFAMKAAMLALAKLYHISVANIVLEKIAQDTQDAIHALDRIERRADMEYRLSEAQREELEQELRAYPHLAPIIQRLAERWIASAVSETVERAARHRPVIEYRPFGDESSVESRANCACGCAAADGTTPYERIWTEHLRAALAPASQQVKPSAPTTEEGRCASCGRPRNEHSIEPPYDCDLEDGGYCDGFKYATAKPPDTAADTEREHHDCEKELLRSYPEQDQANDGQQWECSCGNLYEHVCDEAEGCRWDLVRNTRQATAKGTEA